jgi:hypothetical protein
VGPHKKTTTLIITMKLTKSLIAVTSALALSATPLFAGTKTFKETVVIEEEPSSWYNAALSTGYDSLYMFRGTNVLRDGGYGNSLWWTDANFTWNITDNDFLTVGGWMAFGLGNAVPGYRELNVYTNYVHTFGDLAVGLGYTFYYTFPNGGQGYANELNASVAYDIDLGFMVLTPSVTYFFNLGPDADTNNGLVDVASSYLDLRLDGSIPVIADVVSIDPWAAFGQGGQSKILDSFRNGRGSAGRAWPPDAPRPSNFPIEGILTRGGLEIMSIINS